MSDYVLDDIDRRIITQLQIDGRIPVNALAEKVGLSPTPCARRVRMLEAEGVITGYVATIDRTKLGLNATAFVSVKLSRQHNDDFTSFASDASRWPEVMDCFLTTGPRDYILRVAVADIPAYYRFLTDKLAKLPNIASIETSFVLEQMKDGHGELSRIGDNS